MNKEIAIHTPFIRLDALLKLAGLADTGGAAKVMVQSGQVLVNNAVCLQRGKKLVPGDRVKVAGSAQEVCSSETA